MEIIFDQGPPKRSQNISLVAYSSSVLVDIPLMYNCTPYNRTSSIFTTDIVSTRDFTEVGGSDNLVEGILNP